MIGYYYLAYPLIACHIYKWVLPRSGMGPISVFLSGNSVGLMGMAIWINVSVCVKCVAALETGAIEVVWFCGSLSLPLLLGLGCYRARAYMEIFRRAGHDLAGSQPPN